MLQVNNIAKAYGRNTVLDGISFTIEENGVYGLLGQNGMGKTTMMNIITGYIGADNGDVLVDGQSIMDDPDSVKNKLGYLPETPPLYMDMTPVEYLYFAARLKKIPKDQLKLEVEKAVQAVGLEKYCNRLIRNLSKGYKQRVGIAQAALGSPKVIILDEPMVGLDPVQIVEIRQYIHSLGRHSIVLISSHILSEIRTICKDILLLADSKTIVRNTPEGFENDSRITGGMEICALASREQVEEILAGLDLEEYRFLESAQSDTVRAFVRGKDGEDVGGRLFTAFVRKNVVLAEMSRQKATLEDIFLSFAAKERKSKED